MKYVNWSMKLFIVLYNCTHIVNIHAFCCMCSSYKILYTKVKKSFWNLKWFYSFHVLMLWTDWLRFMSLTLFQSYLEGRGYQVSENEVPNVFCKVCYDMSQKIWSHIFSCVGHNVEESHRVTRTSNSKHSLQASKHILSISACYRQDNLWVLRPRPGYTLLMIAVWRWVQIILTCCKTHHMSS